MEKGGQIRKEAEKRLRIFKNFTDILVSKYGYHHNFFLSDLYTLGIAANELRFRAPEIKDMWAAYLKNKHTKKRFIQLYIGVPYCVSKCSCCIYFKEIGSPKLVEEYKNRLISSVNFFSKVLQNMPFDNIYMGGGTPSIFTEKQLSEICGALKKSLRFKKSGERTFECNPSTTSFEKLKILKTAGFNRISFGAQTLNRKALKSINRDYQSLNMVEKSINWAKEAGIKYINVDLMLGLYGDSPDNFLQTFKKIIALKPYTIRVYSCQPIKFYLDTYFNGKLSNFEKHFKKQKQIMKKIWAIADKMNFSYEKDGFKFDKRSTSAIDFRNTEIPRPSSLYHTYVQGKEASLFCLGHAGNSYIHNQVRYRSAPLSKYSDKNTYIGIKTDKKNEMAYFLINGFSANKSISVKPFKKEFKAELRDKFDYEIKLLKSLKQARVDKDKIALLPTSPKERFIYSMFFIPYVPLLKNIKNLLKGKSKTLPLKTAEAEKECPI